MNFVDVQLHSGIATVVLERGKVNALNPSSWRSCRRRSLPYSPAEAQEIGLVAETVAPEALLDRAREIALELASKRPAAFASIKSLLRKPVADAMAGREAASIREFVEIWYSEPTWSNLRSITIR
jgi:hypothetical protein